MSERLAGLKNQKPMKPYMMTKFVQDFLTRQYFPALIPNAGKKSCECPDMSLDWKKSHEHFVYLVAMKTLLIIVGIAVGAITVPSFFNHNINEQYQCTPCGSDCDNIVHDKPGACSHCNMPLVKKSTVTFKEIPAADICHYIEEHPAAILLDVRTKLEFEGKADPNFGTLKNAINIPIQELESRIGELNKYKNKEIIVFCSHSHRSPRASYILTQQGFSKVSNMSGGMSVMNNSACRK